MELLGGPLWSGTNRAADPAALSADLSPSTRDCKHSSRQIGLLGPRTGRRVGIVNPYQIMGAVPFNVPWGHYTIVTGGDGTITPTTIAWPAFPTTPMPSWYYSAVIHMSIGLNTTIENRAVFARRNYGNNYVGWGPYDLTNPSIYNRSDTGIDGYAVAEGVQLDAYFPVHNITRTGGLFVGSGSGGGGFFIGSQYQGTWPGAWPGGSEYWVGQIENISQSTIYIRFSGTGIWENYTVQAGSIQTFNVQAMGTGFYLYVQTTPI